MDRTNSNYNSANLKGAPPSEESTTEVGQVNKNRDSYGYMMLAETAGPDKTREMHRLEPIPQSYAQSGNTAKDASNNNGYLSDTHRAKPKTEIGGCNTWKIISVLLLIILIIAAFIIAVLAFVKGYGEQQSQSSKLQQSGFSEIMTLRKRLDNLTIEKEKLKITVQESENFGSEISQLRESLLNLTTENQELKNAVRRAEGIGADVSQLQLGLDNLTKENEALRNSSKENGKYITALRAKHVELNDGWIGLFNGFQYKLTSARDTYIHGREECINMKAGLAIYGVQTIENRRTLNRALNFTRGTWIGLNDIESEGTWVWDNTQPATDVTALWHPGEPNSGSKGDCGSIWYYNLLTFDINCTLTYPALCEKEWSNWENVTALNAQSFETLF